jgi:hypothetical protein
MKVRIGDWGLGTGDWGRRARDSGSGIPHSAFRIPHSRSGLVALGVLIVVLLAAACAMPLQRLNAGAPTVSVPLAVKPGEAKVFLDGVYVGHAADFTALKDGLPMTIGAHVLRLEADDYLMETIEVITQAKPAPVEIRMLLRPKEKK